MSEAFEGKQRDLCKPFKVCSDHRAIVDVEGSCLCAARNLPNDSCATELESGRDDDEGC